MTEKGKAASAAVGTAAGSLEAPAEISGGPHKNDRFFYVAETAFHWRKTPSRTLTVRRSQGLASDFKGQVYSY